MNIEKIVCGQIGVNTYIIKSGDECIVIDPGDKRIYGYLVEQELKPVAVLLTHGHFDHIAGAINFKNAGVPVYVHVLDKAKCTGEEMGEYLKAYNVEPFEPDVLLNGGEVIELIGYKISVIHTSGHSKGSVCYVIEDTIFSGDTLFAQSYGRYDFYDGNFKELKSSITETLFSLDGDYYVHPGHEGDTTLDEERKVNMILW